MVIVSTYLAFSVSVPYERASTADLQRAAVESFATMPFVDVDTRDGAKVAPQSMLVLGVISVEIVGDPTFSPLGKEGFWVEAAALALVLCVDVRRTDVAVLRVTEIANSVLTAEAGPVAGFLSMVATSNPVCVPGYAFRYALDEKSNTWHTEACVLEEGLRAAWRPAHDYGMQGPRVTIGDVVVVQVTRLQQVEGKPLSCTFSMNQPGLGLAKFPVEFCSVDASH